MESEPLKGVDAFADFDEQEHRRFLRKDSRELQDFRLQTERIQCCSSVPYVSLLFAGGYLTFVYEVVYRWFGINTVAGFLHFVIASFLIGMLFYNYFKTVMTTPGIVPANWQPDNIHELNLVFQDENGAPSNVSLPATKGVESSVSSEPNRPKVDPPEGLTFCRKCNSLRPPRSHHCSDCGRCVLKYDHHCPWVNNCVGFYNHKYFMLFLVYLLMTAFFIFFMLIARIIDGIENADKFKLVSKDFTEFDLILTAIQAVIILVTLLTVSCLFIYQLHLIIDNTTNIEEGQLSRAKRRNSKDKDAQNIYDRGMIQNLKDVFGPSILRWLWPSLPPGDGFKYPTSKKLEV
eukprot:TRINITY_DN3014_c0_g2_i1.p1 TRINITY_DN3014_c0_g2~~TRINITY_DN3014_c0_g2_i1.p1  ORF type:complete len:347 (-),score=44.07 TRINITY_DN3014_c0_g2_i1:30-1070(-)